MTGEPHLVHVFSTFGRGGPQARTARVLDALDDGYRHTIVAMDGVLDAADWIHPRLEVDFLALDPDALGALPPLRLSLLLRQLAPDLVLTYNWGAIEALAAARLGRWPVIHAEDGFNPDEARSQKRRRVWARRLLLRGAAAVVVPSRGLDEIAGAHWWVPPGRRLLVPNGVDCADFSPAPGTGTRRHLGIGPEDVVVGTVGHLAGSKNVGLLVEALARLERTDVRLLVVGDGPQRPEIRALARGLDLEDRVLLPGAKANVAPYLHAMDVFALGSRTEQMPIAVLEAMASGLPVASTDVGDLRRMLSEPNRPFVVPADDADAMAGALGALVADLELRRHIGTANRDRCVARYDIGTVARRYGDLYERVLARQPLRADASTVNLARDTSTEPHRAA